MVLGPAENFDYYSDSVYWNDFDIVVQDHSRRISGDTSVWWPAHLLNRYGQKKSVFVFNCGNGWVERDLFAAGIIENVTAFDIMPKYVEEAQARAAEIGFPAKYFVADGNTGFLEDLRFDIIINIGSMHHVAFINRMTEMLAHVEGEDGLYVGLDYVGPHRNQYGWNLWSNIIAANERLPARYRRSPRYGHVPSMLATDPSEAVHSELQIEVLLRHFDILEYCRLGGGIAYTLLYDNRRLDAEQHTAEGRAALELIMKADADALVSDPDFNLFAFFVARPKNAGAVEPALRLQWQAEENEREARGAANGGRYYPPTALELIYNELHAAEYQLKVAQKGGTCEVAAQGEPFQGVSGESRDDHQSWKMELDPAHKKQALVPQQAIMPNRISGRPDCC